MYNLYVVNRLTRTVSRLVAQTTANDGAAFESPKKRYEKTRGKEDLFMTSIVMPYNERFIACTRKRKHVTLVSICKALRDDGLFSGGRSSLGKLLGRMGFGYKNQ